MVFLCCFFQAEDGIRDLVRSRGLGDVYKRQALLGVDVAEATGGSGGRDKLPDRGPVVGTEAVLHLSLIHI